MNEKIQPILLKTSLDAI